MDKEHERLNLRVIRASTRAALISAPGQADAHRARALQLLDGARARASAASVVDDIEVLRRELMDDNFLLQDDAEKDA